MSVSKKLIAEGEPLWDAFCSHPFLTGIGDGTLDQKKFQFYMIQDYLYLLDYGCSRWAWRRRSSRRICAALPGTSGRS